MIMQLIWLTGRRGAFYDRGLETKILWSGGNDPFRGA
jgi:hypothetical protein